MLTEGRRSNHQWLIEDSVFGQTGEHLDRVFDALPEAGLCFDVPHAASIDPTLAVAR
ncbi:MAG: hypothetical protein QOJ85_3848, partial [Solirubrobacteraceae bacterium]|nr:hypothetical protein [Solirubrobacteraceae bacterium]